MTIHSYGEYLDWHPHLHLLMADGLFVRSGLFYVLPQVSLKPLEGLFRARVTCPQCYSVAGGSRFSWTGVCCRPRGRTCCGAGCTPASKKYADVRLGACHDLPGREYAQRSRVDGPYPKAKQSGVRKTANLMQRVLGGKLLASQFRRPVPRPGQAPDNVFAGRFVSNDEERCAVPRHAHPALQADRGAGQRLPRKGALISPRAFSHVPNLKHRCVFAHQRLPSKNAGQKSAPGPDGVQGRGPVPTFSTSSHRVRNPVPSTCVCTRTTMGRMLLLSSTVA